MPGRRFIPSTALLGASLPYGKSRIAKPMSDLIGKTLGSYRILEQLGRGGMATVFKAYDPGMDRYVAIKIVSPHFAQHPEFRERFRREAKTIAKLEHAHIIPVQAFGEEGEIPYLVLRYMDTGTLRDRMNKHPMDFTETRRLISQIAEALDYAHRNGVIHRDVKPSNVLIDSEGNAYLTDFGIAKIVEATVELTGTGTAMGTPQYMSPEQCRGDKDLTPATDIYSLGVILYQMLTGSLPFDADTPLAVLHKHLYDSLPPPRQINPQISEDMERVLLKALSKDPKDRYQSARELALTVSKAISDSLAPEAEVVATSEVDAGSDSVLVAEAAAEEAQPTRGLRLPGWAWAAGGLLLAAGLVAGLLATGTLELPGEPASPTAIPSTAAVEVQPPTPEPQIEEPGLAELNPDPALLEDPIPFGDHFYSITREGITWDEAVQLAQDLGGYLVSISDQQENDFVYRNFRMRAPEASIWLGLSDTRQEGEFEWRSGEPLTYTNWDEDQPDDSEGGQDCTQMFFSGRWDDIQCDEDVWRFAVVEFEHLPPETRVPDIRIVASADDDFLWTTNSLPGTTFSIFIYESADRSNELWHGAATANKHEIASIDPPDHGVDLEPGNLVVVSDGQTQESLVLELITMDVFDVDLDILAGTAPSGSEVAVTAATSGEAADQTIIVIAADPNGDWSVDFGAAGVDIIEEMRPWSYAQIFDGDGDANEAGAPSAP